MSKLPRVSGAEAARVLERLGFVRLGQSSSHLIMRHGERGRVVPMHSELKVGTLSGVLRQAQVSAEDFIAALR